VKIHLIDFFNPNYSKNVSMFSISYFLILLSGVAVGQISLFKHPTHFGATGLQICWPNPTRRWLISLQCSLQANDNNQKNK
jgi:hypothetical protein